MFYITFLFFICLQIGGPVFISVFPIFCCWWSEFSDISEVPVNAPKVFHCFCRQEFFPRFEFCRQRGSNFTMFLGCLAIIHKVGIQIFYLLATQVLYLLYLL